MSPGHTTERVYRLLKLQIMHGERRPGERLDPARLAVELNASTTPVRDALHQLLGERMVQAFPGQGFQAPTLSEAALRELYGWTGDLLAMLLRNWRGGSGQAAAPLAVSGSVRSPNAAPFAFSLNAPLDAPPASAGPEPSTARSDRDIPEASSDLFDAVAASLGTAEHRQALRHASDRLHLVRMVEATILNDVADEVGRLRELWTNQAAGDLRTALRQYHGRRLRAVPAITAGLARADL